MSMTPGSNGERRAQPTDAPSPWVQRWSHLVAPAGSVLDVACGQARHLRWFAQHGHPVAGVDREPAAVGAAALWGEAVLADIENGPWPFMTLGRPRPFGAVVVTNYLWRPLFPTLLQSVAENGVLLYETFTTGNESVGKPQRPDFLLQSGELLRLCTGLRVVAYEEGFLHAPQRFVQRIAAVRESAAPAPPVRYRLDAVTDGFPG
ncbi:MAG: class I SAM-dependent methyltransferase [Betaproteobacteria bacterium]